MLVCIEIKEVGKLIAHGVAQQPIRFRHGPQPFVADGHVTAKILRRDPEPHDVRAVLADVCLGCLWLLVTGLLALGNLLAVGIDHEAMREHGAIRRHAVPGQRKQQRGLEPAAMLVGCFEIHVSRIA